MTKRRPARKGQPESPGSPRVIVLAAGLGTGMRSTLPHVLHRVAGRTLLETVLDTAETLSSSPIVLLLGASRGQIEPLLSGRRVTIAASDPAHGTAQAVRRVLVELGEQDVPVLVLAADVPLIQADTLRRLLDRQRTEGLDLVFLSFRPPDAGDLGRVVRDRTGRILRIAEEAKSSARERRDVEAPTGIFCFRRGALENALQRLAKGPGAERRDLASTVEILAPGKKVEALEAEDWREAWGIHTRRELAAAEEIAHRRGIERALEAGATLIDPSTTRIGPTVSIEPDTVIHPFVMLEGRTALLSGCEIFSFTRIADSRIASQAVIGPHCDVEGATVGERARVGPFARLRPGTVLEADVRVGNFVEIKQAVLGRGVKALHLSYLGDAEIGAEANIGAGVITCNFDGQAKNRTIIGPGAFVGSDSQLVAPVTVGEGAFVGAGSTITEDVPPGALALTRVAQKNEEGWVERRKKKTTRRRGDAETR